MNRRVYKQRNYRNYYNSYSRAMNYGHFNRKRNSYNYYSHINSNDNIPEEPKYQNNTINEDLTAKKESQNSEKNDSNKNELNDGNYINQSNIQINKENKEARIEFHNIKENCLKKFYEQHYEKIIKNLNVQKDDTEIEITINDIRKKCQQIGYKLTEEDEKMFSDMKTLINDKRVEYYNQYMFLQKNKKSIYIPHLIKSQKNVLSIFIENKNLLASDFQIQPENNYIFNKLLEKRLDDIKKGNYEKRNKNEYGLITNEDNSIGLLYTSIDEKFIQEILLRTGLENNIKFGNVSVSKLNPTDMNLDDINDNYIRGITNEQLILLIIYSKIGQKYIKKYPRLILYESNIFITGEKVLKYILPGFREVDSIFESYKDYEFEESEVPLTTQKEFIINNNTIQEITSPKNFKITKNKLYFFEIKTSFPNNIIETIKQMIKNVATFKDIFLKENLINKDIDFEIVIIYDFHKNEISSGIAPAINLKNLFAELNGLVIKIIYCKPIYALYSISTLQEKIEEQNDEIQNQKIQIKLINEQMMMQKELISKLQQKVEEMEKNRK